MKNIIQVSWIKFSSVFLNKEYFVIWILSKLKTKIKFKIISLLNIWYLFSYIPKDFNILKYCSFGSLSYQFSGLNLNLILDFE
jgi:hypothetical protein